MSARRPVSPRVAKRRALVADLACAVLVAAIAITIAAGIGVVGAVAVLVLLVILVWIGVEGALARVRRRSAL